jgi:hypothetical protein
VILTLFRSCLRSGIALIPRCVCNLWRTALYIPPFCRHNSPGTCSSVVQARSVSPEGLVITHCPHIPIAVICEPLRKVIQNFTILLQTKPPAARIDVAVDIFHHTEPTLFREWILKRNSSRIRKPWRGTPEFGLFWACKSVTGHVRLIHNTPHTSHEQGVHYIWDHCDMNWTQCTASIPDIVNVWKPTSQTTILCTVGICGNLHSKPTSKKSDTAGLGGMSKSDAILLSSRTYRDALPLPFCKECKLLNYTLFKENIIQNYIHYTYYS